MVTVNGLASSGTPNILVRLNSDTGSNYNYQTLKGASSTASAARSNSQTSLLMGILSSTANEFSGGEILIPDALSTRSHKSGVTFTGQNEDNVHAITSRWADTSAITSVTVFPSSSTFAAGTVIELWVVDESFAIDEQILSADGTFSVTGIAAQDGDIVCIGNVRSDRSALNDESELEFNGDTAANYVVQVLEGDTSSALASTASLPFMGRCSAASADSDAFGALVAQVTNYSDGSNDRAYIALAGYHGSSSSSEVRSYAGRWNDTTAINSLLVHPTTGTNYVSDSMLSTYLVPKNLIERQELGAAQTTVTLDNISQSYDHLELTMYFRSDRASVADAIQYAFNNDTTAANYNRQLLRGAGSSVSASQSASSRNLDDVPAASDTANVFATLTMTIYNYALNDRHKHVLVSMGWVGSTTQMNLYSIRWEDTSPINEIDLTLQFGDYVAGSVFTLRGIRAEQSDPANFNVQGLPQLAGDILLVGNTRTDRASQNDETNLYLNDDETDANYSEQRLNGSDSTASAAASSAPLIGRTAGDVSEKHAFGAFVAQLSNYAEGENDPAVLALGGYHGASDSSEVRAYSMRRNNVEAVTDLEVQAAVGSGFLPGSMLSVYHVPKNVIAYQKLESDAASVTLMIPSGYKHFKLSSYARSAEAATTSGLDVQLNSDTTASNYDRQRLDGDGSTATATQSAADRTLYEIPGASASANVFGSGSSAVQNYTKTDRHKHILSMAGAADDVVELNSTRWEDASAITQVVLTVASGDNFVAGSLFIVEGIGKTDLDWEDNEQIAIDSRALVDWDNDGKYDGTYDDISSDVLKVSTRGGRDVANALTGKVKAARCTLTVANDDDRYSPFNTSSPLTGNLVPKRPVKIRSEAPVVRDLFTGQIERIEPTVGKNREKLARITCLGVFGQLTQNEANIGYEASILSGAAVDEILDAAGWPSADRTIDTGTQTFENWDVDSVGAMTALRRAEESESGLLVESKEGKIAFEDRDHRQVLPHIVAQAEYSDDPSATGVIRYESIRELDPLRFIFNDFRATVRKKATNAGVTLWEHSEANTTGDAPEIEPGDTVTYWAHYPNPASRVDGTGVSAWTALVATTDYTANSLSNGTGTDHTADLSIVETDFARSKKIEITNDATVNVFLTKLQNRGTEVYQLDPVTMQAEDAASQTAYGQRTFVRSELAVWIPDTFTAQEWVDYNLSLFKDPSPMIGVTITGQRNLYHAVEVLTRTISDRVGIEADGNAGLGINEDFFVENWTYEIVPTRLTASFELSSAAAFSAYWTLGFSLLGSETRLNPS